MRSIDDQYRARIQERIDFMKSQADQSFWYYTISRIIIIVGGVCLPFATSYAAANRGYGWIATSLALMIAVLTSLDSFVRPGEMWHHFRTYQIALQRLVRQYEFEQNLAASGVTGDEREFFVAVEELLAEESSRFFDKKRQELVPVASKPASDTGAGTAARPASGGDREKPVP